MKLRRNKKGFTIVELVIVIAVIGILAAVLIPTFVNLNNKANKAADESLVKNLNTALAMQEQEVGDTKNNTMHDAVEDLKAYGYLVENLVTKSDDKLLWNQKTNRFILEDGDKQNYKDIDFWRIQDSIKGDEVYSVYAGVGFKGNGVKDNEPDESVVNIKVGFDAGYHDEITQVNYVRTGERQDVVIRTKGNICVLTIDAQNDHVDHYGYAKTTKVVAVNSENSYHEYGTSNELVVTKGKVVIEDTGVVFDLKPAEGSSSENYDVTNAGGNVMGSEISSVVPSESFEINSLAQLESFRDATNSGETFNGETINLNVDITLNKAWKPISNYYRSKNKDMWFAGTFNGKGHTISGLTNVGISPNDINTGYNSSTPAGGTEYVYGFFASIGGNARISDLKFVNVNIVALESLLGDGVGALFGYSEGSVTIDKITVSGSITGYDAVGGIMGRARGTGITISNCTNNATVKGIRQTAGILGQLGVCTGACTLTNCVNKGDVTSGYVEDPKPENSAIRYWAAGVLNINGVNDFITTLDHCSNNGKISNGNSKYGAQKGEVYSLLGSTAKSGQLIVKD